MRPASLVSILILSAVLPVTASEILQGLDSARKTDVLAGKQAVLLEDVAGQIWPRIRVIQTIAAAPEEVAALFFDYGQAKTFIPKVFKSDISRRVSPREIEVDYGVSVPIFPDEFYTASNKVSRIPGGGYLFEWRLLRAVQTKASVGNFRVEPWKSGSFVCYQNLTTPPSAIAKLLKGKAIEMTKDTVRAIGREAERRKTEDPQSLATQVGALRAALP